MNCKRCSKHFLQKHKTQQFCSQNCARVFAAKKSIKFPKLQDRDWLYEQYWIKNRSMKDISKELGCGETRVYMKMDEFNITRRTISKALTGMRKSEEHVEKIRKMSENRWRGSKNPKWKGGLYRKTLEPRFKGDYSAWRKRVIYKYNNKCANCGIDLGGVCKCCNQKIYKYTHHIKSVVEYPELATDVNNGILYCYACHQAVHKNSFQ